MKIKLTHDQLEEIKDRLVEIIREETALREKQKTENVNGWDLASLSDEKYCLEEILKSGVIKIES